MLLVLVTGMLFGVQLSDNTGNDGLLIILFALAFLAIVLLFLNFVHSVHIYDLLREDTEILRKRKKK